MCLGTLGWIIAGGASGGGAAALTFGLLRRKTKDENDERSPDRDR
jgi:hypothetical protein